MSTINASLKAYLIRVCREARQLLHDAAEIGLCDGQRNHPQHILDGQDVQEKELLLQVGFLGWALLRNVRIFVCICGQNNLGFLLVKYFIQDTGGVKAFLPIKLNRKCRRAECAAVRRTTACLWRSS